LIPVQLKHVSCTTKEEFKEDRTYYNIINAIRAEETKTKYDYCLKDFMKFNGIDMPNLLLNIKVESKIVDYIYIYVISIYHQILLELELQESTFSMQ